jgi:hypothetical protein
MGCFQQKAIQLDDHQSDALTIATAIMAACREVRLRWIRTMEGGLPVKFGDRAEAESERDELPTALTFVLRERTHSAGP